MKANLFFPLRRIKTSHTAQTTPSFSTIRVRPARTQGRQVSPRERPIFVLGSYLKSEHSFLNNEMSWRGQSRKYSFQFLHLQPQAMCTVVLPLPMAGPPGPRSSILKFRSHSHTLSISIRPRTRTQTSPIPKAPYMGIAPSARRKGPIIPGEASESQGFLYLNFRLCHLLQQVHFGNQRTCQRPAFNTGDHSPAPVIGLDGLKQLYIVTHTYTQTGPLWSLRGVTSLSESQLLHRC